MAPRFARLLARFPDPRVLARFPEGGICTGLLPAKLVPILPGKDEAKLLAILLVILVAILPGKGDVMLVAMLPGKGDVILPDS